MAESTKSPGPIRPYGTAIHNCMAEGNLQKMRRLAAEAATYVAEVSAALKALKAEIAKAGG